MSSLERKAQARTLWRSLDDLADDPKFVETVGREFPLYADEMLAPSRRDFLRLMGASVALAGMTACRRWPTEHIVPFAHMPEGYVPGNPLRFATSFDVGGSAQGVLVTSFDGRPVKIEGNPLHPQSGGATDPLTQAAVLELYDPDRSTTPVEHGSARSWDAFTAWAEPVFAALAASRGVGLRVLAEPSSSPTLARLRERFAATYPNAAWVTWDPLSRDAVRDGMRLAFGRPLRPQLDLSACDVLACFDADVLFDDPQALQSARSWARRRRALDGTMNRLWAVETSFSLTGGAADHRISVQSALVPVLLGRLAARLRTAGLALPVSVTRFESHPKDDPRLDAMTRDLLAARGRGAVTVGPRQPAAAHALAAAINAALGSGAVTYTEEPSASAPAHAASIAELGREIEAGLVDTLVIVGGNPAYDAPAELDLATRLTRIKNSIRLGVYDDETSASVAWHLPRAHALESWGDTRAWDGTVGIVQPLIEPLYDGRSSIELLSFLVDGTFAPGYDLVRATHGEAGWRKSVHDGVVANSKLPAASTSLVPGWDAAVAPLAEAREAAGGAGEYELSFARSATLLDGRFANLGWLVELPDPVTKLTWDNAALISPADAEALKLETNGTVVRIQANGKELAIPAYILPGQAKGAVTVSLGWGRTRAGRVGTGVGKSAYYLRFAGTPWRVEAKVAATGDHVPLATTQDHHLVDALGKREARIRAEELVRTGTLEEYTAHPDFAKEKVHLPDAAPLWAPPVPYDGHKWGMSIDLAACTGCHACTIACQAENNIPVVGKSEVLRGREMHWIRVDRYFDGEPEAPGLAFQPLTCHHCENAPCEQVCPVAATVHDHEGLNVMVYNRCVGVRYCANNCPYKVRRFNYFNNHKHETAVEMMVFNPEVTVRSRGVMEKCSFCVQRINAVKIASKNAGRKVADGEIVPACAQVCPTEAIVFGDLNDPTSRVKRMHEEPRAYGVLEELNTRPRTKYLARLTNPGAGEGTA